jgi:hypothetical protein
VDAGILPAYLKSAIWQNQCFKLNFNNSLLENKKLDVSFFDIKLRMATTFKSIIFYSYFKVVADYRIPGQLLGHCRYMLF